MCDQYVAVFVLLPFANLEIAIVILDAMLYVQAGPSTLHENNRRERLLSQGNLIVCFNFRLFKLRNTIY